MPKTNFFNTKLLYCFNIKNWILTRGWVPDSFGECVVIPDEGYS